MIPCIYLLTTTVYRRCSDDAYRGEPCHRALLFVLQRSVHGEQFRPVHRNHDTTLLNNPLGCATLLPVKICRLFRNISRALNFCRNFTGKGVAQQESPFYYQAGTILPYREVYFLIDNHISL
jgi:hypothetical protein